MGAEESVMEHEEREENREMVRATPSTTITSVIPPFSATILCNLSLKLLNFLTQPIP